MDPETARESALHFMQLVMTLSALLGVGILIAHLLLPDHRYLRGLGCTFVFLAIALGTRLVSPETAWFVLPTVAAFVALVFAFVDAVQNTRERIRRYQDKEREREAAFAEYLSTVARSEKAGQLLGGPPSPAANSPTVPTPPAQLEEPK